MPGKAAPATSAESRTNNERSRGRSSLRSARRTCLKAPGRNWLRCAAMALGPTANDGCEHGGRRTHGAPFQTCRGKARDFTIPTRENDRRLDASSRQDNYFGRRSGFSGWGRKTAQNRRPGRARARAKGSQGGRSPGDRAMHARGARRLHHANPTRKRGGWLWPAALAGASGWCPRRRRRTGRGGTRVNRSSRGSARVCGRRAQKFTIPTRENGRPLDASSR
jgi:hypothetical protein